MSANWVLALIAAALWIGCYTWYFVGLGRLRAGWDRVLKAAGLRRPQ